MTEEFSPSPLLMGSGQVLGLDCFGGNLVVLSNTPKSVFTTADVIVADPSFIDSVTGIGFDCLGLDPTVWSEVPVSSFVDPVFSSRDFWLNSRSLLSNWKTETQSEEDELVSLSNQGYSLADNPLLMGGLACIGLTPFGLFELSLSKLSRFDLLEPELFDVLATEDLDPIVTEDEMDAIALG